MLEGEHPVVFLRPEQLITSEKEALSLFFGKEIVVPQPPKELFQTLETLSKLSISKIEPHYLPQTTLKENDNLSGWVKQRRWFWEQIEEESIAKDSATLKEGWYLLDGRGKPNYQRGRQMYEDDYLVPIIVKLTEAGKIQKYRQFEVEEYRSVYINSRFGGSPNKIEEVILPEFAKLIGTDGNVRNIRAIEFNVWGNMFHPEWGQTNTQEWFADIFKKEYHLVGGYSPYGGLAHVYHHASIDFDGLVGFRPLVEFPVKS